MKVILERTDPKSCVLANYGKNCKRLAYCVLSSCTRGPRCPFEEKRRKKKMFERAPKVLS